MRFKVILICQHICHWLWFQRLPGPAGSNKRLCHLLRWKGIVCCLNGCGYNSLLSSHPHSFFSSAFWANHDILMVWDPLREWYVCACMCAHPFLDSPYRTCLLQCSSGGGMVLSHCQWEVVNLKHEWGGSTQRPEPSLWHRSPQKIWMWL